MRRLWTIALVAGCTVEAAPTPSISFVAPSDGDTVTVGDVPVTLLIEHFELVPEALQHNEGAPEGHVILRVDGEDVLQTGETNVTVPIADEGPATIEAELVYEDGDPLEPPVVASIEVQAVP